MATDNGNAPAFPFFISDELENAGGTLVTGLTKREEFAKAAMMGDLASSSTLPEPSALADYAVRCADALLAELAKREAGG